MMRVQTKYLLFVTLIHLAALVLSFFVFSNRLLFIASELVVLISLFISWKVYQELIRPLKLLADGADAISDRDFSVKFLLTGTPEMDKLIHVYNQMIDELRRERTLQEEQHFFLEKLIHTSPTGIIILDYDKRIKDINPRALQLLQAAKSDLLQQSLSELDHPVFIQLKELQPGASCMVAVDGSTTLKAHKSTFIDRGFPRHFILLEELTAELLAAEKRAYGKLIRMLAHEVNNSIGAVNSIIHSTIAAEKNWQLPAQQPYFEALQVAAERNQNLTIFMRNFADLVRLPEPQKKSIDLVAMIRSMGALMQAKARQEQIQFEYQLPEEAFYIMADEQQLEQVFINIIKNAMEAIETSGIISFSINRSLRELRITDTGRGLQTGGLQPGDGQAIFTPFYSTKKDGQGIGLTLVKEVLVSHGFRFSLNTVQPGETVFSIRF